MEPTPQDHAAARRDDWTVAVAGRLVGSLGHDLNNILAVVIGGLDLLERQITPLDDPPRAALSARAVRLRSGVERAIALAGALRGLGRPRPGEGRVEDLAALAMRLRPALDCAAGARVRLRLDIAPNLPRPRADPAGMRAALLALALQAGAGLPEGGAAVLALGSAAVEGAPGIAVRLDGVAGHADDPDIAALATFAGEAGGALRIEQDPPALVLLLPEALPA